MIYKNINLKWLGHSCVKIILEYPSQKIIYIDPFKLAEDEFEIDKADYIFITHSHHDHCSIEDIKKIAKDNTIVICTPDCQSKFSLINKKLDIKLAEPSSNENLGSFEFWAVPAYNLNKSFHEKGEDWVGYLLKIGDTLIYHAGDTDVIPEMKRLPPIDIALLPAGGTYTMNSGEAAKAASLIKPKIAIPIHYGALEGTQVDIKQFLKFCSAEGIDAKILEKTE